MSYDRTLRSYNMGWEDIFKRRQFSEDNLKAENWLALVLAISKRTSINPLCILKFGNNWTT